MNHIVNAVARILQALLAALLLTALLPLLLLIGAGIMLSSPGPVLYASSRIGRRGKPFRIVKFRSMSQDASSKLASTLEQSPEYARQWQHDFKLDKDPRITPFGRFLRKTSLDELPQLWNVMVGDMNFIGPRPIVEDEKALYGEALALVNSIKPGITGLWQVSGRNDLPYSRRIELDLFYVNHHSFLMDAVILCKTFREIAAAHGK